MLVCGQSHLMCIRPMALTTKVQSNLLNPLSNTACYWPMSCATHHCHDNTAELIDCVVVLCPTRHKIDHFGDVLQANLLAWYGKKHTFTNQKKCATT